MPTTDHNHYDGSRLCLSGLLLQTYSGQQGVTVGFYLYYYNMLSHLFSFFFNLLFILNRHWHTPVFFVHPALHRDVLVRDKSSIVKSM